MVEVCLKALDSMLQAENTQSILQKHARSTQGQIRMHTYDMCRLCMHIVGGAPFWRICSAPSRRECQGIHVFHVLQLVYCFL